MADTPSQTNETNEAAAGPAPDTSMPIPPMAPVAEDPMPKTETTQPDQPEAAAQKAPTEEREPPREPAAPPTPAAAERVIERRGPGFLPLLLGGALAAAIGYGLAYFGILPVSGTGDAEQAGLPDRIGAQEQAVAQQGDALTDLQSRLEAAETQVADLANAPPLELPDIPEVDLSAVETQLADLTDVTTANEAAIQALGDRIQVLEDRPIISPEAASGATDEATAAAIAQLETRLREQQATIDTNAEELRALSEEAQTQIAEAQAQLEEAQTRMAEEEAAAEAEIAAATAEAAADRARAEAQAALGALDAALAEGEPYAEELDTVAALEDVTIPDTLADGAETGIATLDELQTQFPEISREALPIAIQATAGDDAMGRMGAFLQSQFGGRALTPQEGDGPDAVLSRAEAAVREGELMAAVDELQALPEDAKVLFEDWIGAATRRAEADAALDDLRAALSDS